MVYMMSQPPKHICQISASSVTRQRHNYTAHKLPPAAVEPIPSSGVYAGKQLHRQSADCEGHMALIAETAAAKFSKSSQRANQGPIEAIPSKESQSSSRSRQPRPSECDGQRSGCPQQQSSWADCEQDFSDVMTEKDITAMRKQLGLPHWTRAEFEPERVSAIFPEVPECVDPLTEHGLEIGRAERGRKDLPLRLSTTPGRASRGGAQKGRSVFLHECTPTWRVFSRRR